MPASSRGKAKGKGKGLGPSLFNLPPEADDDTEKDKKPKVPKIRVFVEVDDGPTLSVQVKKGGTIGDLKEALCTEHGYLQTRHMLQDPHGIQLEDLLSLDHCGVKKDSTVQLLKRADAGAKRLHAEAEAKALELQRQQDELALMSPFRISEEDQEEAVKSTLRKAMTSGGRHAKELCPRPERQEARKLAQQKATFRHDQREHVKEEASDLASVVSGVVKHLFPNVFVQCNPTLTKKHSMGGA